MCHFHGRKGYLWAGKAQSRKDISWGLPLAATCPSAFSPACGHWHRRATKHSIDSDRCRCPSAVSGMTNFIRALPDDAGVNLGSRNRRNSKHTPQIQRAAMPVWRVWLHRSDQVFRARQLPRLLSHAYLNSWTVQLYLPPWFLLEAWSDTLCESPLCLHCWLLEQPPLALTFLLAAVNIPLWTFQPTPSLDRK